jgi:hypothetical protein
MVGGFLPSAETVELMMMIATPQASAADTIIVRTFFHMGYLPPRKR